jgi:hypothetical protein
MRATLTLPQVAQMVVAWSLVHGFAILLFDSRRVDIAGITVHPDEPWMKQMAGT